MDFDPDGKLEKYLIERLQQAYKKLKASVYYDKTQVILRAQIAEYESNGINKDGGIDSKIQNLARKILTEWDNTESKIIEGIESLPYPKKIEPREKATQFESDTTQLNDIISLCDEKKIEKRSMILNAPPTDLEITDYNYFIKMDVEGHILGTLWVMDVGKYLDSELYCHSYGNRLKTEFIDEEKKGNGFSPHLFKHYFSNYEKWRKNAIETSKDILKSEKDVLFLRLDLKRFYYCITYTDNEKDEIYNKYFQKVNTVGENATRDMQYCLDVTKPINDFIFNVFKKYGTMLNISGDKDKPRMCVPIGFNPSCILSNYRLKTMDSAIIDQINPSYYGRYVDDLLIVIGIDKYSTIHKKVDTMRKEIDPDEVINYFFGEDEECLQHSEIKI